MFSTWTRFATPGTRGVRRGTESWGEVLTLLLTVAGGQNNAWPVVGFAIALNIIRGDCPAEAKTKTNDDDQERIWRSNQVQLPTSRSFSKHAPTAKHLRVGHVQQRKMSTSEDDSDVPEQVSLSSSKRQVIGKRKDVAKVLAQAESKRKEHNRERDRQLKQQSSKPRTNLIPDEENSSGEGEVAKDPRLLPDHLFAAAFNQPSPTPGPSVPKDAPHKTQQKVRKRAYLTPRDRIIGQAFPSPSKISS